MNIIDRYLVVCEAARIEPLIVVNKGDLFTGQAFVKITQTIPYEQTPKGELFVIKFIG